MNGIEEQRIESERERKWMMKGKERDYGDREERSVTHPIPGPKKKR